MVPSSGPAAAPRIVLFLPVAFFLHVMEEWFGGFSAWTLSAIGVEVSPVRFIVINACALTLVTIVTVAATRNSRLTWLAASVAALLGLNGAVHALATLGLNRYSPGTVTGVLLYLPLSVAVLRSLADRLTGVEFVRAMVLGMVIHAIVVIIAFAQLPGTVR
jgi:hypothetical protein